ncbi:MAG: SLC13 family permease [Gammaproteobacteria bacterium]|nr:SLC13 family permease [Gammaproteobacteria bacterium]MYD75993.1 SLC13 family permease [Gammaproteobacteria bacterium]MYJ52867.1 SLC13 family permease [Gammaproteobacteria bacterium]
MSTDQIILFSLLGALFGMLVWGRIRYDLVAFGGLMLAVMLGVVPANGAFMGFSHPATVIIALVLVVSTGLSNSGAIELVSRYLVRAGRSLFMHIGVMSAVAAMLSAVMNNVAALAMMIPIDVRAADKAKRSPSLTLMPLSFASILGGLITLIGTPPNIIIASFREQALGEPFGMFDFSPVGLAVAVAGVLFVALIGWRLIPASEASSASKELLQIREYVAEVRVAEKSRVIGKAVQEQNALTEDSDVEIIGLSRRGKRFPGDAAQERIAERDILVIRATPDSIDAFVGENGLEYVGSEKHESLIGEDLSLAEVVVPRNAYAVGRNALDLRLLQRYGVNLLGVSRQGMPFEESVRQLVIRAGDVLLLLGPTERLHAVSAWLGGMPLQEKDLLVAQRHKAELTVGIFCLAIASVVLGIVDLAVALGIVSLFMIAFNIVPVRDLYESIEWPVIVLLGSLIPIGAAFESSGGSDLVAQAIVGFSEDYSPVLILGVLMVVTMTLSDLLDNTATAVMAAPVAVEIANELGLSPDPFLMAVAVSASCAFLTPIGHKNNTLIMGPGGYRFGDYWRMGLPLEVIVILVSVPMIVWVWPLSG